VATCVKGVAVRQRSRNRPVRKMPHTIACALSP